MRTMIIAKLIYGRLRRGHQTGLPDVLDDPDDRVPDVPRRIEAVPPLRQAAADGVSVGEPRSGKRAVDNRGPWLVSELIRLRAASAALSLWSAARKRALESASLRVTVPLPSKPGSTSRRFWNVRSNSPEPIKRTVAKAT